MGNQQFDGKYKIWTLRLWRHDRFGSVRAIHQRQHLWRNQREHDKYDVQQQRLRRFDLHRERRRHEFDAARHGVEFRHRAI